MSVHNSIQKPEVRIYLGMIECFDGGSPSLRTGHIVCYSFFRNGRFITFRTYVAVTDPEAHILPESSGMRLREILAKLVKEASGHIHRSNCASYQIWNGYVYHPENGGIANFSSDGVRKVEKISAVEFDDFEFGIKKHLSAPAG